MSDDAQTPVKTYIPAYQKDIWCDHAEELDMSQSEFVRTMVQAGRSSFELDDAGPREQHTATESADKGFQDRITEELAREGLLDWDDLVDRLLGDVEADIERALDDLQNDNIVRYSGRHSGYELISDEHA